MIHKPFFCIVKFYISIKSIMATSQLFVLSVKLKILMFGKDAINSINIQGAYEPYHFQPFPKKLHIFLFKSTHAHNSAIWPLVLPDFPLLDIFKKVLVYFSQPCSQSCLVFNTVCTLQRSYVTVTFPL